MNCTMFVLNYFGRLWYNICFVVVMFCKLFQLGLEFLVYFIGMWDKNWVLYVLIMMSVDGIFSSILVFLSSCFTEM